MSMLVYLTPIIVLLRLIVYSINIIWICSCVWYHRFDCFNIILVILKSTPFKRCILVCICTLRRFFREASKWSIVFVPLTLLVNVLWYLRDRWVLAICAHSIEGVNLMLIPVVITWNPILGYLLLHQQVLDLQVIDYGCLITFINLPNLYQILQLLLYILYSTYILFYNPLHELKSVILNTNWAYWWILLNLFF